MFHLDDFHRAAMGMFLFYDLRSRYQEGQDMFRLAAEAAEAHLATLADSSPDRATWTLLTGFLMTIQGWFHRSSSASADTEVLVRGQAYLDSLTGKSINARDVAFARVLAAFAGLVPDRDAVEGYLLDCLAVFEACDDRWGMGATLDAVLAEIGLSS